MKPVLKKIPGIDFFIGFVGGDVIPTKQDKFKHVKNVTKLILENGEEEDSTTFDVYIKKSSSNSLKQFEERFKKQIEGELKNEHPYPKDQKLEIYISISMNQKRITEVDIDNLCKSVIDCFKGLVFEDDSQIQNLMASKDVNSYAPLNGILVGIRKINSQNDSWLKNIKIAYIDNE